MSTGFNITVDQLADAFTEWERRYREDPDRFMSESKCLLTETPHTYGQACAPYLISILKEQGAVISDEWRGENGSHAEVKD